MFNQNWKQQKSKKYDSFKTKMKHKGNPKSKDEMKQAFKDEDNLKRKNKRLTIDWFFWPKGD